MQDLIKRLEAATEPSRELDAEIATLSGWEHIVGAAWQRPDGVTVNSTRIPCFTNSIDAALTLVGEGWEVGVLLDAIDLNRVAGEWIKHLPRFIVIAALKAKGGE
ncbi:MAG: hypothetical protein HRT64_08895 [Erythrobacter sp.]|nr:hypothetical protein [Erythrobacter sp.]